MATLRREDTEDSNNGKRPRGKYASRACLQCRQRKLKCSGEDPCQRCVRRSHQCIFSDDRAVAEILRRTRQQLVSGSVNMNGALPLEARVERLEAGLRALAEKVDGDSEDLRASVEPETAEQPTNFHGDTAFKSPIDTFNASLTSVKQQLGFTSAPNGHVGNGSSPASTRATQQSEQPTPHTLRRENSAGTAEIRIGSRTLPFPSPNEYHGYLDFFFDDINCCHPCVNEADFRARSSRLVSSGYLDRRDSCFLALHYIMFACTDLLLDTAPREEKRALPGGRWYQAADDLVGRQKFSGQGDLSLIQFLIFEAFYLTHEDRPNAAYNIAGLACRLCFQFGLHQQSRWVEEANSYQTHMKQRIFWTTYFVDRRIALSCGRPYGIRDSDVEVDLPAWVSDRDVHPDRTMPPQDLDNSFMMYLSCMVNFARLGGDIWDQMFSAGASKTALSPETIALLDAKIVHWSESILPTVPILPVNAQPTKRHMRQQNLVRTRVNHLRLLLRRRLMVSLSYSAQDGRLCGDLAMQVIQMVIPHSGEARQPSSFRFHMAVQLSAAILILATLLCRPLHELGLLDCQPMYIENFRQGQALLQEIASGLQAARRLVDDLRDITNVVAALINQPNAAPQQIPISIPASLDSLFPYGALDFAQQTGYPYETYHNGNVREGAAYHYDGWQSLETVETDVHASNQVYGVSWI